jgi:hypothetical protein
LLGPRWPRELEEIPVQALEALHLLAEDREERAPILRAEPAAAEAARRVLHHREGVLDLVGDGGAEPGEGRQLLAPQQLPPRPLEIVHRLGELRRPEAQLAGLEGVEADEAHGDVEHRDQGGQGREMEGARVEEGDGDVVGEGDEGHARGQQIGHEGNDGAAAEQGTDGDGADPEEREGEEEGGRPGSGLDADDGDGPPPRPRREGGGPVEERAGEGEHAQGGAERLQSPPPATALRRVRARPAGAVDLNELHGDGDAEEVGQELPAQRQLRPADVVGLDPGHRRERPDGQDEASQSEEAVERPRPAPQADHAVAHRHVRVDRGEGDVDTGEGGHRT